MRLRVARELRRHAGHAVVEARADRDQEVAVLDRVVGERGAVHAEHAHATADRVVSTAPMPISVVTTGMPKRVGELAQRAGGVAVDHAAAGVDQRALRLAEHLEEARARSASSSVALGELVHAPRGSPGSAACRRPGRRPPSSARPSACRRPPGPGRPVRAISKAVRTVASSLRRVGDQEDVLRDGAHDRAAPAPPGTRRCRSRRVGDLAADHHDRHRIGHAVAHRRDGVRRARARRSRGTRPPGRSRARSPRP